MTLLQNYVSRQADKRPDATAIVYGPKRLSYGQLETAAQAIVTIVVYDYTSNQSAPIPDEWRAAIKQYELAAPSE